MEQKKLISWSCGLKIDYFLTAACGPLWVSVNNMQSDTAIQCLDGPNVQNRLFSSASCAQ